MSFQTRNGAICNSSSSRAGPILALGKDSFRSFWANHFILYNIEFQNSCIQYARKLFRPMIQHFPIFQLISNYGIAFSQFICSFSIFHHQHFCCPSMSASLVPPIFLWACARPRGCPTASFCLIRRQLQIMRWLGMCSGGLVVLFAGV